jgi:biotin operon repressor
MKAIRKLERLAEAIEQRPALIQEARDEGATWEQIAAALGMSRAGVIKLYNSTRP